MEKVLTEFNENDLLIITNINFENLKVANRLYELGFFKGAKIRIVKFSSLKKTLLVEVQSCLLSLRASVGNLIYCVKL